MPRGGSNSSHERQEEEMKDAFLDRMWADHHERFSADAGRVLDGVRERVRRADGDPLPVVARAMALVLAVSLASLSVGATLV
jgi:hypothetical protein